METQEEAQEAILAVITADEPDVRQKYLNVFGDEASSFSANMAEAYLKWMTFNANSKGDEDRALVSAVLSFKRERHDGYLYTKFPIQDPNVCVY